MKDLLDDFTYHLKKDLREMQEQSHQTGPCFTSRDVELIIDRLKVRLYAEEFRRRKEKKWEHKSYTMRLGCGKVD